MGTGGDPTSGSAKIAIKATDPSWYPQKQRTMIRKVATFMLLRSAAKSNSAAANTA